jgi:gamma-glutamylcyclotransferase (GGCT)/AIG2-like uncharacterized protein YtfP
MNALNKLWNSAFRLGLIETKSQSDNDGKSETSDGQKFRALISLLSGKESGNIFVRSPEFRELVELEPRVMDMKVLEDNNYDPSNIGEKLRREATKKHTSLFNSYTQPENSSPDKLLNRMSAFLYIIRSNLSHGEKTSNGPDIEKSKRDKTVCRKALPVAIRLLEILLNESSNYLATYGTLQDNDTLQKYSIEARRLPGEWSVEGNVEKSNGLFYFNWISNGKRLAVTLYEVNKETYRILDKYEGKEYRRICVPAFNSTGKVGLVVNIYTKNDSFNLV